MGKIYDQIKERSKLRVVLGLSLVVFGLIIHLIPLVPGSWVIFIGLEILGIRLLVQDKIGRICARCGVSMFIPKNNIGDKGK
jgi:hypothetical protein